MFTPDGDSLLLGQVMGEFARLDLAPGSWQAPACGIANRNLSFEDWSAQMGRDCYRPTCNGLPLPADLSDAAQRLAKRGDAKGATWAAQCAAKRHDGPEGNQVASGAN